MIARVNGIDLFYEKSGSGRPVIMVHGNGEDHRIFDEASALLSKKYTCYCVDSRGHGQSSPVKRLHYDDMAQDMVLFLEALNLEDVVFYGFSDGGITGLLAAGKSSRITTLIVSGANLTPEGVKLPLRLLIRAIYFFKKDPKLELMLKEPHISDEALKRINVKTLVLAGEKDLVLEKQTRHIAKTIPGARLKILSGEGHGSYIIHKEKIGKIIRWFVSDRQKKRRDD